MAIESNARQRFAAEAKEHLARMISALMALERSEADPAAQVAELLRSTHSLKGDAGFSGLVNIEKLAHAMETAAENVRDGRVARSPEVIDSFLFAVDRISALVDDIGHSEEADISVPLERMQAVLTAGTPSAEAATSAETPQPKAAATEVTVVRSAAGSNEFPISHRVLEAWQRHSTFLYGVKFDWFQCEHACRLEPIEVARRMEQAGTVLDSRMELSGPPLREGSPIPPLLYWAIVSSALGPDQFARQLGIPCAAIVRLESVGNEPRAERRAAPPASPKPTAAASSLRIPVSLIDRMMGLAGELVLIRNQAKHSVCEVDTFRRQVIRRLDAITNELQDAALRMRMQPVGTLFDRFPRLVRDLARQLGKQIELEISGTEVELDKAILELLADPLTHLVRNCCDHGIEMPEDRVRLGKTPSGRITLKARQERGQILIQIRDDGRGLDREAIKRKALQQGVKRSDELDRLNDRQLYDLILLSGFSTATKVTDLSGRGVGMDVVRANLEQIGGVVEIDSTAGAGATFTLRLPLTLAIVPCLLLSSRDQRFAIPQRDVEEIVLLDPADGRFRVECGDDEELLRLRGRLLPVARLGEILGHRRPLTSAVRAEIITRQHGPEAAAPLAYVIVVKVGSQRFGLVVDALSGSEEIVVKPLHPLLRPLGVYSGTTILGDGSAALILSVEGLARHSGIAYRPQREEPAALPAAVQEAEQCAVLLFRCGAAELLAMSLDAVRRVVRIRPDQIERVGNRELVNVDGVAINVLRLDHFLNLSSCQARGMLFLIMPRHARAPVGLLASEIVDTPTQPLQLDDQAYRADGVLGSAMIRGQIAIVLDIYRLVEMWKLGYGAPRPALPAQVGKRILVVEDTQFFRQLTAGYLKSDGHDVAVAANGEEGVKMLAAEAFDLVVSDIEMPVMDGLAFARQVRQDSRYERLPMLALSSLSGDKDREAAIAAGFDAYEVKINRQTLLAKVGELLAQGRSTMISRGGPLHE
ncbi:MAG TPA: chemotaxis protein CheW [Phycisphaerae bacterium]|nr:chemotaxis protein CheW [Phycisphaerae bacterium]